MLSPDTHWNTGNMIYGDSPLKINEGQDALGLNTYTIVPDIYAIRQSSNLYVYCGSNPVMFVDPSGEIFAFVTAAIGAVAGAIIGGVAAAVTGNNVWAGIGIGAVVGGVVGLTGGAALAYVTTGSVFASTGAVLTGLGLAGTSGTIGATVYQTWQQAEQALRNSLNAISKTFATPFGNRIVDAWNATTKVIAEAKYGEVALTQFIQQQIAKDVWLLQQGIVSSIEWHFYVSQATGLGGPSGPLLQALLDAGIKVVFH